MTSFFASDNERCLDGSLAKGTMKGRFFTYCYARCVRWDMAMDGWGEVDAEPEGVLDIRGSPNGEELSLNLLSSVNLLNHWSMNQGPFKDPVSYVWPGGWMVRHWTTTKEVVSMNNQFNYNKLWQHVNVYWLSVWNAAIMIMKTIFDITVCFLWKRFWITHLFMNLSSIAASGSLCILWLNSQRVWTLLSPAEVLFETFNVSQEYGGKKLEWSQWRA